MTVRRTIAHPARPPKAKAKRPRGGGTTSHPALTENGFLRHIVQFAELHHWMWAHIPDSRRAALSGTPGAPDLLLVHIPTKRVIVAELKLDRGVVSAAQHVWADVLGFCDGVEYRLWRPRDWDAIEADLEMRRAA